MSETPTKTCLTASMMGRGVSGLILFGSGATVLMSLAWVIAEPGDGGFGLGTGLFVVFFSGTLSAIVWGLGSVVVALPIWALLHAFGVRGWPAPVAGGAGLVALIWYLNTPSPVVAAAGALAGAAAGWGMWRMAYGRARTGR